MTSKIIYNGNLRTTATHLRSGISIETDAPTDNNGKGERFSPTDLVATALGSCMLTLMGIAADRMNLNIEGTTCEIEKVMAANPRRIAEVHVKMNVPNSAHFTEKDKLVLQNTAMTCPVFQSLHSDMVKTLDLTWS